MYCEECGKKINNNVKFCTNCGHPVINSSEQVTQPNIVINNVNKSSNSYLTASIVLGIITIILSFVSTITILPIGIIGLVFGILSFNKNKKSIGIVLNVIGIVLSFILLFVYIFILALIGSLYEDDDYYYHNNYYDNTNAVTGKYHCTDNAYGEEEYVTTLNLYEDGRFLYGPYNDMDDNYAKGEYTYDYQDKGNTSTDYDYYMITFNGYNNGFMIDGEIQDNPFNTTMEFGITKKNGKKEGVTMFTSNYNLYYCYEQ